MNYIRPWLKYGNDYTFYCSLSHNDAKIPAYTLYTHILYRPMVIINYYEWNGNKLFLASAIIHFDFFGIVNPTFLHNERFSNPPLRVGFSNNPLRVGFSNTPFEGEFSIPPLWRKVGFTFPNKSKWMIAVTRKSPSEITFVHDYSAFPEWANQRTFSYERRLQHAEKQYIFATNLLMQV